MKRVRNRKMLPLAAGAALLVLAATVAVADEGAAVPQAPPGNQSPPTISGSAQEGSTLTANEGRWTGQPTSFAFSWRRCDRDGGNCSAISGATRRAYTVQSVDVGDTLRVRVTATNADGSTSRTSVPTGVVTEGQRPGRGCDANAPLQVQNISAPDRLNISAGTSSPPVVGRSTQSVTVRFQVTCKGKPVQGALLYAAPVPFNQFRPGEQPTGADGMAAITMGRLAGFPAARQQRLLVVFARARKPGEALLGGISNRRLVSFRVNLSR
jgi:Ig domain of plant-specific actin-binding protein